jgi:filamentous hemagglutinin family protein
MRFVNEREIRMNDQPLESLTRWGKLNLTRVAIAIAAILNLTPSAIAQITPDATLGAERSIVAPNVPHPRGAIDLIDGGAIRGFNLFHSFQDFNVSDLQQVYFANPTGIENILGRVTGTQSSSILGTLGVLGNANLFLINPNGIFFGPDARLDVPGSFFASTSPSLLLENGYEFSTVDSQAPPLLTVNVRPGLQVGLPQGDMATSGNLAVGGDLTFISRHLNLNGQIQAGENLTLQASETLTVRDSTAQAFIASAGGELLAQGHKIDIFALNHPSSGFFSGADMRWRSSNAIGANAQFSSGGNFLLETLTGNPGNLSSTDDPIIRASGDVSFDSYVGPSLHIFAGGSVTINSIRITGPDTTNFINQTVTLSDGVTTVPINGSAQPTVDIRAGTTAFNPPGIAGDPSLFSPTPSTTGTPTRAEIAIDTIIVPGGLVFLSNQDQPNLALPGDITVTSLIAAVDGAGGGDVFIDSRGKITTPGTLDVSGFDLVNFSGFTGRGGDITLLAQSDIVMPNPSTIFSYGTGGGNITLKSQSAIIQEQAPLFDSFIESAVFGSEQGGDVILEAPSIFLSNFVQTNSLGAGAGGELRVTANMLEAKQAIILNFTEGGNTGKVTVNANSIMLEESQIGSQTRSLTGGNAGDVEINANSFVAKGPTPAVLSVTEGTGNGGTIRMNVGSLALQEGAQIRGSTQGGNAGSIEINADDIGVDGAILLPVPGLSEPVPVASAIVSEVLFGSSGNGSAIEINTRRLRVSNGAGISASTSSSGDAGSILIMATESVAFDGNPGAPLFPSGAFVGTLAGATGKGGTLTINTPSLSVTNGAQLEAETRSGADAGNIVVNAGEVKISGAETGLFSNTTAGSTGQGGGIVVNSDRAIIANNARISVDSEGEGRGGNIAVRGDRLILEDGSRISAETASTDGGDIGISLSEFLLLRRGSQISTTAGNAGAGGDGGNITIVSPFIVAVDEENSDITANAFFGRGGNINITTTAILGLEFRPKLTPLSDITATSQFGLMGIVIINNLIVDLSSGLVELPEVLIDPSDQVVVGCAAAEGNAFTITGRGGLPEDPTSPLRGQTLLSDLRDFSSSNRSQESEETFRATSVQKLGETFHTTSVQEFKIGCSTF